jgi:hypothetical protein
MRMTLRICILPLLAGLFGSMLACSEGTTAAKGNGGGGGEENTTGGTTANERGGASAVGGSSTTAASGGTTTTTTVPAAYTKCFDFNESTETWKKNYASAFLLTDKTKRDETAAAALLGDSTADWMAGPGYGGTNGYVQLSIPFATTQSDFQGLLYSYLPAVSVDLTGKVVHAFVKLVSGMTANDASKPSGAKLVVKSGSAYLYADGGWQNLSKNEWTEIKVDGTNPNFDQNNPTAASTYDPTDIREISVEIDTSGAATTIETPGIVYLDHVCY